MYIPMDVQRRMISHCRSLYPNEACGLLAGKNALVVKIYEMTNSEPSPVSYFMEPSGQFKAMKEMRTEGLELCAIYHSHPQSPAWPSAKDVELAFYDNAVYVIVGLMEPERPDVRAFRIIGREVLHEVLLSDSIDGTPDYSLK